MVDCTLALSTSVAIVDTLRCLDPNEHNTRLVPGQSNEAPHSVFACASAVTAGHVKWLQLHETALETLIPP
jgi:hypothetical protein